MHKCTSYGPDKLNIWPFWPLFDPCDLSLLTTWKNVSNGTSTRGKQLCKIILKSMYKCTSYGPDKLNIWPFWPLFDPCDLDLLTIWKNVSNETSTRGQQLCKIILKSMHKCTSYGQDKLNIWPFWPLFDPWPWPSTYLKNVSTDTSPPWGQQLCIIILKYMHKCTSYGLDKFNTCIWPFWPLFDPCDLDLKKCFKWHFSSSRATTVPNCFAIHALLYKLWSGQIWTDARTYTKLKL